MRNLRPILLFVLLAAGFQGRSQDNAVILQYIDTYKEVAVLEMQRTGVPASIKLAQGIHETMAGTSELVRKSNNHFGIKCKTGWTGESVTHDDDYKGECFRKYEDPFTSYKDHSDFLKGSQRYASLFNLDPLDYRDWAYGLKKAGYATNPKYPVIIIKLIEDYHLQDYSMIALGKMEPGQEMLAKLAAIKNNDPAIAAEAPKENAEEAIVDEVPPSYPSGEFRINDTKVIYATKGTSFLAIAQQYHVPLARIFEFNEIQEAEVLDKNQLIYLQRKRKHGNNEFHDVRRGETLVYIAQVEGIRMESLLEYNYLSIGARPAVGERLYLHKKAPAMPKLQASVAASNKNTVE